MPNPIFAMIIPLGGGGGGPVDPGWGVTPGWDAGHPGNRPPGSWDGTHPGNRPPGSWDGTHPGGGPIIPPVHVGGGPILNPEIGTPVPPEEFTPEIPPETISSQYLVSVYNPKTQQWTTKSYSPR
jgi:hypothetical protein